MKQSSKVALGGMVAALSVALMFLTAIPAMTFALPALAGALLILVVIEIHKRWAFMVYVAVAILALLMVPDRSAAVMYAMFFGYYPVIKALLESKLPKALEWVCKLAVFNMAIVAAYCVITFAFGIPLDELDFFSEKGIPVAAALAILLTAANLIFLLYDFALSKTVDAYLHRWRKRFLRIFK